MPQVSEETHINANAFMTPLERMIELVDDVRFSPNMEMTDGLYLDMMNTLNELRKLGQSVRQTTIYVEVQRQARAPVQNPRKTPAEIYKEIARGNKKYMVCPKCKKPMTTRHYKEKHSKTRTCTHIEVVREHQYGEGKKKAGLEKKQNGYNKNAKHWKFSNGVKYSVDIEFMKCALMESYKMKCCALGRNCPISLEQLGDPTI